MIDLDFLIERFNFEINTLIELEQVYAREKAGAALGAARKTQTPYDLVQVWKKTYRARDLKDDINEAHRNVQSFSLAIVVELLKRRTAPSQETRS